MCKIFGSNQKIYFERNTTLELTEEMYGAGFVHINEGCVNVSIAGFSAKNVSIKNGVAFIGMFSYYPFYEECRARVDITNVLLEDIVEIFEKGEGPEGGLIFNFDGPVDLTVRNLIARNLQFKSILRAFEGFLIRIVDSLLLEYSPIYSTLPYEFLPQMLLQNIKISNSSNSNFLIKSQGNSQIENVELVNVTSRTSPVFCFSYGVAVSIKNIYGRNIYGSAISLEQVFSQNLQNLTFHNVSKSPDYSTLGSQYFIFLTRYANITNPAIYEHVPTGNTDQSTVITDFFIDVKEKRK